MLHIIRTPESAGRPEKFIFDAIVANLSPIDWDGIWDWIDTKGRDPRNGADFYDATRAGERFNTVVEVARVAKKGDYILVCDAQAPIVPTLRYLLTLRGFARGDVRVGGWFHSSCYQPGDMLEHDPVAESTEYATMVGLDVVFAATDNLASNLRRGINYLDEQLAPSVVVTKGLPVDHVVAFAGKLTVPPFDQRDRVLVWPHRYAPDKGVDRMLALAKAGVPIRVLTPTPIPEAPDWLDVVVCPTKGEYYTQLAKARGVLSTATLETFGYAVMEAVVMGCTPILPAVACYPEMYRTVMYSDTCNPATITAMLDRIDQHCYYQEITDYARTGAEVARTVKQALLKG